MTFDQIKATVKGQLNLTSSEADTRVGEAVNRHYKRVTSKLGMEISRRVTRSASMTTGVQTVTFANIEKIDRILDTTDSTAIRLLTEVDVHRIRGAQPSTGQPMTWAPYTTESESVTALFDTLPQTAYSLQADGWAAISDLVGNDEPGFAASYHDILTFYVLSEELLRKEKDKLAVQYERKADLLLAELVHHLADSPTREDRQGGSLSGTTTISGGGGSGTLGATAYTQSALLTFDLGAGVAPFAVAQTTAAMVANLDADKLDGLDSSDLANALHATQHQSGGIDAIALDTLGPTTDTTDLNATTTKHGLLPKLSGTSTTFLNGLGNYATPYPGLTSDGTKITKVAFPATQVADTDANTIDDFEKNTWTPTDGSGATLSFTGAEGYYVKVGPFVFVGGRVTYPVTGDGSSAVIGGLPATLVNSTANLFVGGVVTDLGANAALRGIKNTTTAAVVTPSTSVAITNATLSTRTLIFNFAYRATS